MSKPINLKPILQVKTLLCYKDDDGNIFKPNGVSAFETWAFPNMPVAQNFNGMLGEYSIEVKLVMRKKK